MSSSSLLLRVTALLCAVVVASPVGAQTATPLTLRQALQRALAYNPKIIAAERDIGIATGRHVQAGAIPNPEISFELDNAFGTGDFRGQRSAERTIGLGQLIELGGKRDARLAVGAAELESARWQRDAERLEVLSETAINFFNVLGGQNKVRVYDEQIAALDRLAPLLQRRVDTGASSPAEVARARVAADVVRAERERARVALAISRRELAVLMGAPAINFSQVTGDLDQIGRLPTFAELLSTVQHNPQLMRWTAVRAQKDAELLSARLNPIPDVKVEVGWKRINEPTDFGSRRSQAFRLGASMPIPVWDQNLGSISAAQEERAKVEADRDANRGALILLLAKAYDTQSGAVRELEILRNSALPNARRAAEAIESGYTQGRFTLLEVLDAPSTAAQVALREQEALISFHTSVATIQGLTGISLGFQRTRGR